MCTNQLEDVPSSLTGYLAVNMVALTLALASQVLLVLATWKYTFKGIKFAHLAEQRASLAMLLLRDGQLQNLSFNISI